MARDYFAAPAWLKADRRIFAHSFQPAACPKALTRIGREIRSWALHHRNDKSLTELAQMYNPCIRGCITYYSHFYKTQLRPTLKRIPRSVLLSYSYRMAQRWSSTRKREIVTVRCAGADGCLAMIEQLQGDDIRRVMGNPPKLIGRIGSSEA
jgi:hypothetical protein